MTSDSLRTFKRRTEQSWANARIHPHLYGFQIAPGTRWLPGLSEDRIRSFEAAVGASFPHDYRELLRQLNGTDKEAVNVYGGSGEPSCSRPGIYSFPRDLAVVKDVMSVWAQDWEEIRKELGDQGTLVPESARCVPFFGHRGILCTADPRESKVLSIMGTDAIVYGDSLEIYLEKEFPG